MAPMADQHTVLVGCKVQAEAVVNSLVRASVLCAAFVALTGQAPAPVPVAGDAADFCTRLGRNMGLDEAKLAEKKGGWKANALNFGQRFLVGGTASTSVNVEPVEPATVADYKRVSDMCAAEGNGAVCRLVGPVNFVFGWKGTRTVTAVRPAETAVVAVEGIKTFCQVGTTKPT